MGRMWRKDSGNIKLAFIAISFVCLCIFYVRMTSLADPFEESSCDHRWLSLPQRSLYTTRRTEIYEKMSTDLAKNGPLFLDMGTGSQGLKLSELFNLSGGQVLPLQKPVHPPIRAIVLNIEFATANKILQVVRKLVPASCTGAVIWYQDPKLYHSSMYHASHHLEPVPANREEIGKEIRAVSEVANRCCPLEIRLQRVVLTSTGVLLGCWQVLSGTDPFTIRNWLKNSLPNSPSKQLYDPVIFHTSFARILGTSHDSKIIDKINVYISHLNMELCNFQATVRELWFVEEMDVLALALNGRFKEQRFPLKCGSNLVNI